MADIQLKYLQDLEAASKVNSTDLMHISQSSLDRSITVNVITSYFINMFFPVGSVIFRADASNPNQLFPGTTWVKLPANVSIRTAAENASDVMATGGADTVALNGNHLPAHSHSFINGATNSTGNHTHNVWTGNAGYHAHSAFTDAQGNHAHRAWTDAQGAHAHNFNFSYGDFRDRKVNIPNGGATDSGIIQLQTDVQGLHSHNVGMDAAGNHGHNITVNPVGDHSHPAAMDERGAHSHTVTGSITSSGSNTPFSVVNAHVKLVGWRRTA